MSVVRRRVVALPVAFVGAGLLWPAGEARAASYYVATNGNDGGTVPGSEAEPFRTIRRAIQAAQAGDTVFIRGGTYAGWENQINPIRSGRADAWITFRNYERELPILEPPAGITGGSAFEPLDTAVSYIRVEGIAARNWPSSGFSNGWNHPSSNIQVRYCIAEGNGVNGITFYKATGVLFEYNIVAHNGNRQPSWSSGINLFTAGGSYQTNVIRGNVSFENIDICGDPDGGCDANTSTDGNGFILDEGSGGALFVNNIAFRNGGSCIRLTNSPGAHIINNTCFHNALDTGYAFAQDEIFFSDGASRNGAVVRNNVAAGVSGIDGINAIGSATAANNVWVNNNGATPFFAAPTAANPDFRSSANAPELVNAGGTSEAPANDIGFDPRCIRQQTGQAVNFWQYAPDYSYIQSIGGVAACFHPTARPQGGAPDIGAYESGATATCTGPADCDDGNQCTTDTCGGTGQCNHAPIAGCCLSAADCNDSDVCTTDTCDTASGECQHAPTANCCMASAECDDGNPCTADGCNLGTHQCTHNAISRCCTGNEQCTSPSACVGMVCETTARVCVSMPVAGCCAGPADCDDGDPCTADGCDGSGTCQNTPIAECCALDGDCADTNPCTADACNTATRGCENTPLAGCCAEPADCDDVDPCTVDSCNQNLCSNVPGAGCATGGSSGAGGSGAVSGTGPRSGGGTSPAGGTGPSDDDEPSETTKDPAGCGCRAPGSPNSSAALFAGVIFCTLLGWRRRRKRRVARTSPV